MGEGGFVAKLIIEKVSWGGKLCMIACVLISGSSKYPRRVKNFKEGKCPSRNPANADFSTPLKCLTLGKKSTEQLRPSKLQH